MGETPNPVSCSLILRFLSFGSCFPIQGKGCGNQGAVSLPVGGVGEGCRFASAGTAGAVFLLLLEFTARKLLFSVDVRPACKLVSIFRAFYSIL